MGTANLPGPDFLASAGPGAQGVTGAGLGIGLTGMCERVRDLGGVLHIDSDFSGTAVRVMIPVASGGVAEKTGSQTCGA